jgi:hypothetical protein
MPGLEIPVRSAPMQETSAMTTVDHYARPLAIVTTLFFMWGFLTSLNDILVPHLKSIFDLSYARAMLIQFAFFSAYFLFSIPWSKIVNAIGYQKTMVAGLLSMAVGALLFVPAASFASFALFLGALIVLAAGITGLQVAANPYVVVLGKPETASSRLDLAQGVQLARHDNSPCARRAADPQRFGTSNGGAAQALAASTALAPRRTGSHCEDAVHRDQCCVGSARAADRDVKAADDQDRGRRRCRESRGFDLETSQSDVWGAWHLRLCGRGGLCWQLPRELSRPTRHCGAVTKDGG